MKLFIALTLFSSCAFACKDHVCGGRAPLKAEEGVRTDARFKGKNLEYLGEKAPFKYLFRVTQNTECQEVFVSVKTPKNCKMTSKIEEVKACTR